MAKGHTHLKKLRSEKSKVKLKGKTLAKGQNVTDTTFKIKQIVVREQLKSPNDQAQALLSKRKLNIKDLLMRLQHYNSTAKSDAITDLKDMITHFPREILLPNLCPLIQGVSHLVLDKDKLVRRESLKLIDLMLAHVTVAQVAPFFDILVSYFRCAMTHIDTAIQEDSLLLLDALLSHVPALVAQNSSKMLGNFFDLISKLRTDSKPGGRTLTVNLNSKITTVKWRIKVLNRLYQLLNAIIDDEIKHDGARQILLKIQKYTSHIPVYQSDYVKPCLIKLNASFKNNGTANDPNLNLIKYFDQLVPLLFETWLEVGPGSHKAATSAVVNLTEEATSVLNCILNIFQLLHVFISLDKKAQGRTESANNFINKYAKDFSSYIFAYYPYTQIITRKRKRNDSDKPSSGIETFCITENLMITHLFTIFNQSLSVSKKIQHVYVKKLFGYVQNLFEKWTPDTEFQNKQTALVLRGLLLHCDWPQYVEETQGVVSTALIIYNNATTNNAMRADLLDIFCEIVDQKHLCRTTSFQQWLAMLPELLLKSTISARSVDMILLLARQKNVPLLKALKLKYRNILLNVATIKIVGTDNDFMARAKIIELAYYLPPKDIFEGVNEFMKSDQCKEGLEKILIDLLRAKFQLRFESKSLELFEFY